MMKTDMWKKVLFFGAIWGLLEATLGYVLHLIPGMFSGLIMFPIAVLIMVTAYRSTGNRMSIFWIGVVAAAIKSVDLLLPGLIPMKTFNPMMAIIIESAIVAVVYPVADKKNMFNKALNAITLSVGWRAGFVVYMYILSFTTGSLAKWLGTPAQATQFIVVNGLIASVFVLGAMLLSNLVKDRNLEINWIKWSHGIVAAMLALVLTYTL